MANSLVSARARGPSLSIRALADAVILSQGWTRRAIAFVSGAAGALAMAPFNIFPALAIPMVVSVWLLDGAADAEDFHGRGLASMRMAAFDGWWLGFGYFVAGLRWLGDAILVEADRFAWALPLGVLGLPAAVQRKDFDVMAFSPGR